MPAGDKPQAQGPSVKDRQVRVFISSTFRDMHAERDHLVTVVFPELRERVEQLGLEFFDVDLRWGVPAKTLDGETANSWEYCRQWIDRIEPFFVCILGQRYGWVPEPHRFREPADRQQQEQEPRSITDLEVRHAVLDNRRKRRSYFYLRTTPVPLPAELAGDYVDPPEYQDRLTQLKTAVRQCGRPVRDYRCRWTGQGFAEMEDFGRLVLGDLWSGVLRDERYVSKDVWRRVLGGDPDHDPRYTDESVPVPNDIAAKIVALAKPPPQDPLDAERQQMDAFAASRLRCFQGRTRELRQLTDFLQFAAIDAPRLAVVAAVPGQGKSAVIAKLSQNIQQPEATIPNPPFLICHFVGATDRSATAHALVERLLGELDRSGIEWPAEEQKAGEEPKRDFNSLSLRLTKRLGDYAGERQVVILLDALNQLTDGHDLHWLPNRLGPSVRVVVSCVEDPAAKTGSLDQRVLHAFASRKPAALRVPLGPLTEHDVRTIVVEYLTEYCKELDRGHVDAICRMDQAKNPLYLLVLLGELRTLGGNDMNRIVGERIMSMPRDYPDTVALFRWVLQRLEVLGQEAVRWWCLYLAHGRVGMASHELADLFARKLGADAAATALRIERGLRRYLQRRGPQLDFFHGQLRQAVFEQYDPQTETDNIHREIADYFIACAKGSDPQKEWETDSVRGFAECVFHLTKAGHHEQAAALLTNFSFLLHKLRAGLLESACEDYGLLRREAPTEVARQLEIWADFFREKAHILRRGNEEWPAHKILLQLAVEHTDDSPLTIGAEQWLLNDKCRWLWMRRAGGRNKHLQPSPCLSVLEGHHSDVTGAKALDDGRVLSWSNDGTLKLWDGQGGSLLHSLDGHTDGINGALVLDDGRILSCSDDRTLRVWDGNRGELIHTLKGHIGPVKGAMVLPDERFLSWGGIEHYPKAKSARDFTVRLWDPQDGSLLLTLEGHLSSIKGVELLSGNRLLSWAGVEKDGGEKLTDDCSLRIWDLESGNLLHTMRGHSDDINGVLVLANGKLLSWSTDETLRLWDPESGLQSHVLEGHHSSVVGVKLLPDGTILSWSSNGRLIFWEAHDGQILQATEIRNKDNRRFTLVNMGVEQLADGRLIVWSGDGLIRLCGKKAEVWRVVEFRGIKGVAQLPCGRIISWDQSMQVWDKTDLKPIGTLAGHTWEVNGVQSIGQGRLLSWSEDNTLRIWDVSKACPPRVREGHSQDPIETLWLTNGHILSWSKDNELRLWDRQTGGLLQTLAGHTGSVGGAQELMSGRILSWSHDNTLRLWDARTGAAVNTFEGHTSLVNGALELADARVLSWSYDKSLRIWDQQTGGSSVTLEGHTDIVNGALQLPDGRILSWSYDKTLRLWDGRGGSLLSVQRHAGSVRDAWLLADGVVASRTDDDSIGLWDPRSELGLQILSGDEKSVHPGITRRTTSNRSSEVVDGRFLTRSAGPSIEFWSVEHVPWVAWWHADCECIVSGDRVSPALDGTIVATREDCEVCVLHLYYGARRIMPAEIEQVLPIPSGLAPQPKRRHFRAQKFRTWVAYALESESPIGVNPKAQPENPAPKVSTPVLRLPPRQETNLDKLRESARINFGKGYWEAAETALQELLARGEPVEEIAPKMIVCLLNAHETPLESDAGRIQTLFQQLEQAGHADLAAPLREQLQAKLPGTSKKWWKFW